MDQPRNGDLIRRLPPQNLDAERGVLGSVLLDNDALPEVVGLLRPQDFFTDAHQVAWEAVRDLDDLGAPVDAVTLAEELKRRGELARCGGVEYLAEILNSVPHAANARYYAEIVRQKSVSRAVIEACEASLSEAYSYRFTAGQLLEAFQDRAAAAGAAGVRDGVTDLRGPVNDYLDQLDARAHGASGVLSPWADVNGATDGWQPGMLYIVAARPSMGKSVFVLQAAEACGATGPGPALVFTLEMKRRELVERLICARADLPVYRVRDPAALSQSDRAALAIAADEVRGLPLLIDETASQTVGRVCALARKYHRARGVRMVVLDYLQLLDTEDGSRDSRQEHVARVSRRLKVLAGTLEVPVIVVSQLNRNAENREDRRPRLADLRESGAIEQDADMVILLHRPEFYDPKDAPGMVEVHVAKNRNGPTGSFKLRAELDRFRFLDAPAGGEMIPDAGTPDVRAAAAGPEF